MLVHRHFEQIESLIPNEDEVELGEFSEAKGIAALFAGLEKRPGLNNTGGGELKLC